MHGSYQSAENALGGLLLEHRGRCVLDVVCLVADDKRGDEIRELVTGHYCLSDEKAMVENDDVCARGVLLRRLIEIYTAARQSLGSPTFRTRPHRIANREWLTSSLEVFLETFEGCPGRFEFPRRIANRDRRECSERPSSGARETVLLQRTDEFFTQPGDAEVVAAAFQHGRGKAGA